MRLESVSSSFLGTVRAVSFWRLERRWARLEPVWGVPKKIMS
jgi:hypothetical protein